MNLIVSSSLFDLLLRQSTSRISSSGRFALELFINFLFLILQPIVSSPNDDDNLQNHFSKIEFNRSFNDISRLSSIQSKYVPQKASSEPSYPWRSSTGVVASLLQPLLFVLFISMSASRFDMSVVPSTRTNKHIQNTVT